jgi:hypothetical protein
MLVRISGGMVRYGLPGLIVGVALSWMVGARGPVAVAQVGSRGGPGMQTSLAARGGEAGRAQTQGQGRQPVLGEANGTLALVASPYGSTQWLYLIDTRSRAFAIYRVDPSNPKGSVKLEAARQYQWDLKLEHYNNQAPEPGAIESMVRSLAQPMTR